MMCFVNSTFQSLFGRRPTIAEIKYENPKFVAAIHPYWASISMYKQTPNKRQRYYLCIPNCFQNLQRNTEISQEHATLTLVFMTPARESKRGLTRVPRVGSGPVRVTGQRQPSRIGSRSNTADGSPPPQTALPPLVQANDSADSIRRSAGSDPEGMYELAKSLIHDADFATAFRYMERAARMGHEKASLERANMLEKGIGCTCDRRTAYKIYKRAADNGDATAAFRCARMLKECGRRNSEMFVYLETAAEQNVPGAMLELGLCYRNGWGVNKNLRESAKIFKILADQGDTMGMLEYAIALKNGWGVTADRQMFVGLMKKALDSDSAEAKIVFAHLLETGDGYEKDVEQAEKIYRELVKHGSVVALFKLGVLLQNTGRDDEAMECLEKAAERHHLMALFSLAMLQLKFPRLRRQGMANLKKAADQDNPRAQYNYAIQLEKENGSKEEITKYYQMASDAGLPNAMCNYASLMLKTDPEEALRLFKEAADKGHPISAYRYAKIIQPEQSSEALRYYRMAAEKGHVRSQYELAMMTMDKMPQQALVLLRTSSQSGYAKAQQKYTEILSNKGPVQLSNFVNREVDFSDANDLYRAASQIIERNAARVYFEQHMNPNDDLFKLRHAQIIIKSNAAEGLETLSKMIDAGNQEAKYVYARLLAKGKRVKQNLLAANRMYQEGTKVNHPGCMCEYSKCFKHSDFDFAMDLARRSAEKGWPRGQYRYGRYLELVGRELEARTMFRQAADQGLNKAQFKYAEAHVTGHKSQRDRAVATKYYAMAAERGNARAQNNLGSMYESGQCGRVDFRKAAELFLQSADRGNHQGLYNYARLMELGLGVEKDELEAVRIYRQLLDVSNNGYAQYRYARMLHNGIGVPEDIEEASKWYLRAIEQNVQEAKQNYGVLLFTKYHKWAEAVKYIDQGVNSSDKSASAQYNFAQILIQGMGVPQNRSRAEELLSSASETFIPAMVAYAQILQARDNKTEETLEQIVELYKGAADTDKPELYRKPVATAQYQLGLIYRDGIGVDKDEAMSTHYLELAAANGHHEAEMLLHGPAEPRWDLAQLCL